MLTGFHTSARVNPERIDAVRYDKTFMSESSQNREQWFTQLRAEWFRVMRPFGSWVPWELREHVQLEEVPDEPSWGRSLIRPAPQLRNDRLRDAGICWLYLQRPQEPISAARADCIVLPTRTVLLEHLPHGGTVAEIGTLHGDFAREILRAANPKELHLVDKFIGPRAREMGKIRRSKGACMSTSPILQRR